MREHLDLIFKWSVLGAKLPINGFQVYWNFVKLNVAYFCQRRLWVMCDATVVQYVGAENIECSVSADFLSGFEGAICK